MHLLRRLPPRPPRLPHCHLLLSRNFLPKRPDFSTRSLSTLPHYFGEQSSSNPSVRRQGQQLFPCRRGTFLPFRSIFEPSITQNIHTMSASQTPETPQWKIQFCEFSPESAFTVCARAEQQRCDPPFSGSFSSKISTFCFPQPRDSPTWSCWIKSHQQRNSS